MPPVRSDRYTRFTDWIVQAPPCGVVQPKAFQYRATSPGVFEARSRSIRWPSRMSSVSASSSSWKHDPALNPNCRFPPACGLPCSLRCKREMLILSDMRSVSCWATAPLIVRIMRPPAVDVSSPSVVAKANPFSFCSSRKPASSPIRRVSRSMEWTTMPSMKPSRTSRSISV
ncbi:hypothetical protein OEIGOIKO_04488 [Streptomyces chrestomyceticus JCM 4735]|uniref:Uncharacterized protein n=1 Tax=Streptomyces chrestomyceticus JCM 4735 TaxID=1306181 RepID=A0A7U9PXT3_9ACTN|nr:hypothetical protein OEIGOIKO_04488 [Streptomyces chrestomyceticus JCM 4735]